MAHVAQTRPTSQACLGCGGLDSAPNGAPAHHSHRGSRLEVGWYKTDLDPGYDTAYSY